MLLLGTTEFMPLFGQQGTGVTIPWKTVAVGGAAAGAVGFLSGLGWSMGMGIGAASMSPNTQRENAKAYQEGIHEVDRQWMVEEAAIQRQIKADWQDYDRSQYLSQQVFNAQVDQTVKELKQQTQAVAASSGYYELTL